MSIDPKQISHLPDITDKLNDSQDTLPVEIAEFEYLGPIVFLNYVAGRATVNGKDCLIAAYSRHKDGWITTSQKFEIDKCSDYKTLVKLDK